MPEVAKTFDEKLQMKTASHEPQDECEPKSIQASQFRVFDRMPDLREAYLHCCWMRENGEDDDAVRAWIWRNVK